LQKILKLINNDEAALEAKTDTLNSNQLTNLSYLNRVAAGDIAFIDKMIKLFIAQTPSAVQSIKEDMLANNWLNFRSKIHKLMPSISFMGITALAKELHEIDETKITPDNLAQYNWVVEQLELIVKQSCDELNEHLQTAHI
jgi:HPt (histidine-containing phosphotransfer) domain-containing protein